MRAQRQNPKPPPPTFTRPMAGRGQATAFNLRRGGAPSTGAAAAGPLTGRGANPAFNPASFGQQPAHHPQTFRAQQQQQPPPQSKSFQNQPQYQPQPQSQPQYQPQSQPQYQAPPTQQPGSRTQGAMGTGGAPAPPELPFMPQDLGDEMYGLSDAKAKEIEKVFGIFDLDKNGYIDLAEFLLACKSLDVIYEKQEARSLLEQFGQEVSRSSPTNIPLRPKLWLNQEGFFSIVGPRLAEMDPGEDAIRAFRYLDHGNKGWIDVDDLRRVAERISTTDHTIESPELRAMLEAADMDGDGVINQDDFLEIAFT